MSLDSCSPPDAAIADDDWRRTPPSVKGYLRDLTRRLADVEQRLAVLEEDNRLLRERLANHSGNSSQPPSADPPGVVVRRGKPATGRKRGGQSGHDGNSRKLVPVEQCQKVVDHDPRQCRGCGGALVGEDPEPYRHQVVEVPPIMPSVAEHRWHQLTCAACGTVTRARLRSEVSLTGYGPRVVALVAVLSGRYRLSERMRQSAMQDLFGMAMALGTVNTLRQEASAPVVVVPRAAIQTIGARHGVFVPAEEEGRFLQRTIQLGRLLGESFTVLKGLEPGEIVVTEGSFFRRAKSLRNAPSG
jgi:transposase